MYLTSTKLLEDKNGKKFSWSDIFVNVGKIIEMTVVSAFVDDDTLHSLIEELQKESGKASMRDSVRLKIFIDAAASRFAQKESQEKFLALNKIIEDACWNSEQRTRKIFTDDSGIHLVSIRNTRLFHSKMILCKSTTKMRMILGSVNFTKCAFNNNEELAIVGDVDITDGVVTNAKKNDLFRQALEYEKILNDSLENDKNHDNEYSVKKGKKSGVRVRRISKELANSYTPIDDDLYAYLMRGSLFYSKPVCFSEYFPLNLPKGLLQKKMEKDKTIKSLLGKSDTKKSISVIKLLTLPEEEGGANQKLSSNKKEGRNMWRSLCIPTSFGFWCASEQKSNLEEEKKKNKEYDYYSELFCSIKENKKKLKDKFLDLIKAVENKIREADETENSDFWKNADEEEKKKRLENIWQYANKEQAGSAWDKWIENLINRQDKLLKESEEIIFEAQVPYLSEDVQARSQFLRSFIESIDRIRETDNARGSGVVDEILKNHSELIEKARKELGMNSKFSQAI